MWGNKQKFCTGVPGEKGTEISACSAILLGYLG